LRNRGFGSRWLVWIEQLLAGFQTCVNFNGSLTLYFHYKRGLRQGDPLSSFLFDLVTDTLCQILIRGRDKAFIQRLAPALADGHKIINFYYADDTIFFLKAYANCVEAIMWVLIAKHYEE
jgi:Reverse transcriptase (RNA-dependent DNA polymerase)